MALSNKTKICLIDYLCHAVDNLLERKDTDSQKQTSDYEPFHMALLPSDVTKITSFERSFSTSMGKIFENCASIIAKERFTVVSQNKLVGTITTNTNAEIDRIITRIDQGDIFEDYIKEVKRIVDFVRLDTSKNIEKSVVSDLYLKDKQNHEMFFEIKSPKPNKEQCLNITRKHLWIHVLKRRSFPETKTYFAMPYNPYGDNLYKHSFSIKYLDMPNQVLIGKNFWNTIGGNNAYEELL